MRRLIDMSIFPTEQQKLDEAKFISYQNGRVEGRREMIIEVRDWLEIYFNRGWWRYRDHFNSKFGEIK